MLSIIFLFFFLSDFLQLCTDKDKRPAFEDGNLQHDHIDLSRKTFSFTTAGLNIVARPLWHSFWLPKAISNCLNDTRLDIWTLKTHSKAKLKTENNWVEGIANVANKINDFHRLVSTLN